MRIRGKRILAALMGVFLFAQSAGSAGFIMEYPKEAYAETKRSATVNATSLNIRSAPGTGNSVVARLSFGAAVTVVGEENASDGVLWYKVRFNVGGTEKEGYASSQYIKFPVTYKMDAEFENYLNQQGFPDSYKDSLRTLHAEFPSWVFQVQNTGLDWNDVINNESSVGANLVSSSSISSWKSTEYGAYNWNTGKWTGFDGAGWVAASRDIVSYYMDPRNFLNEVYVFQFLLHTYDSAHQTREGLQSLISGTFLENSTAGAAVGNAGGTAEPGNNGGSSNQGPVVVQPGSENYGSLNPGENYGPGYDFSPKETKPAADGPTPAVGPQPATSAPGEQSQKTDNSVSLEGPGFTVGERQTQTVAVPSVEYGPGMDASAITGDDTGVSSTSPVPTGESYVDMIMNAAAQSGVNPYVLGAMILQEQGKGTSGIISGKTAGYEGYYNFFNVGAFQTDSMSAVTRGLWYAAQSGSYGRPWNTIAKSITGGAMYYGENFVSQGQDTFYLKKFNVQGNNLYKHQYMTNVEGAAGEGAKLSRAYTDEMKKQTLVFKIPVFNNMPATACAKPAASGSPNNKLSSLEAEGYSLTPTFNMDTESYDVIVNPSVSQISVKASALDSKATVSGTGVVNLQSGNNTVQVEVKAENGSVRTYKLNVVRQANAPAASVPVGAGSNGGQSVQAGGSTAGPGGSTDSGNSGSQSGAGSTSGPGSTPVRINVPETTASQDDVPIIRVGESPS